MESPQVSCLAYCQLLPFLIVILVAFLQLKNTILRVDNPVSMIGAISLRFTLECLLQLIHHNRLGGDLIASLLDVQASQFVIVV